MKKGFEIGVIGQGFVGSAIKEGLKHHYNVRGYDLDPEKCSGFPGIKLSKMHTNLISNSDIIFVCLPTPMRKDGSCDTRILERELAKINDELKQPPLQHLIDQKVFVIKSTVPPGTTKRLGRQFPDMKICFSPEFLTEANSFSDFKNQTRIIIGGPGAGTVKNMFAYPFPHIPIVITDSAAAEMVKYYTNCFLATKVTFANQMYDICKAGGIDYDDVRENVILDERIGDTHLSVPGPDGDRGFGGHCVKGDVLIKTSVGPITFEELYKLYESNNISNVKISSTNYNLNAKDEKSIMKVVKNPYAGKMIRFKFKGGSFECTEDHLIPISRDGNKILTKAKYIKNSDELFLYE